MVTDISTPKSDHRFWWLYVAGWVPFFGIYASIFVFSGEATTGTAIIAALNHIPTAVLGLLVVRLCTRIPWSSEGWGRTLALHSGLALAYAVMSAAQLFGMFVLTWPLLEAGMSEEENLAAAMVWEVFMGLMLYAIISSITYAFLTAERLQHEANRAERAETLRTRAELQALRAQLNPHFLFNTLHSLIALVRSDSGAAEDAIEQFADLLRYASRVHQDTRDEVLLREEWEFVQNYLALESLRLGPRLRVEMRMDNTLATSVVPSFCLQPLVENAIRHAIAPRTAGGKIWIKVEREDDNVAVDVRDDGPGAEPGAAERSGRLGLRLVRQRLEAIYGDQATIRIDTAPDAGFHVRLCMPIRFDAFPTPLLALAWSAP